MMFRKGAVVYFDHPFPVSEISPLRIGDPSSVGQAFLGRRHKLGLLELAKFLKSRRCL